MKHQNPRSKETMISSDVWNSTGKKCELIHLEASLNKMTNKVSRDELELIISPMTSHLILKSSTLSNKG
jgi:hypothetical protein